MIETSVIAQDLCRFIESHALSEGPIGPETDLLSSGVLDSMLVIDLVSHVEATHGVALADEDITPRHFRSVAPLAELIEARRTQGQGNPPRRVNAGTDGPGEFGVNGA